MSSKKNVKAALNPNSASGRQSNRSGVSKLPRAPPAKAGPVGKGRAGGLVVDSAELSRRKLQSALDKLKSTGAPVPALTKKPKKALNEGSTLATAVLSGVSPGSDVQLLPGLSPAKLLDINRQNAALFVRSVYAAATTVAARNPDQFNMPSATMASKVIVNLPIIKVPTTINGSSYQVNAGTYAFLEVCSGAKAAYRTASGIDGTTGAITWNSWMDLPVLASLSAYAWVCRSVGTSAFLQSLGKPLDVEGIVYHAAWQGGVTGSIDTPNEWASPNQMETDMFQTAQSPLGLAAEQFSASTFGSIPYVNIEDSPWNYDEADSDYSINVHASAICYKFVTSNPDADVTLQATLDHRFEFIPLYPFKHVFEPMLLPDASPQVAEAFALVQSRVLDASSNRWLDSAVASEMLAGMHSIQSSGLQMPGSVAEGHNLSKANSFWGSLKNFGGKAYKIFGKGMKAADRVLQTGRKFQEYAPMLGTLVMAQHFRWVADKLAGRLDLGPSPLSEMTVRGLGAPALRFAALRRPKSLRPVSIEIVDSKEEETENPPPTSEKGVKNSLQTPRPDVGAFRAVSTTGKWF